jgi:deoxyadenosine/deoxycytidine kinase
MQVISIEGNIGSGKSTIINILKEKFLNNPEIVFLQEPVLEWNDIKDKNGINILTKFYEEQEKYSFAFQMMAYISRLNIIKNIIKENKYKIIITERCLNTDRYVFAKMLYDSGKLNEIEYKIYLNWFDSFLDIFPEKTQNKIIYLKTSPNICFERVNRRNREGESNISLEYLENCHLYHENMIENLDNILYIDSNINIKNNILDEWYNKINNFIYN